MSTFTKDKGLLAHLLELGACPICHGSLTFLHEWPALLCERCHVTILEDRGFVSALPKTHAVSHGSAAADTCTNQGWAAGIAADMNKKSQDYSRKYRSYSLGTRGFLIRRDLALELAGSRPQRILEAGCGPGVISPLLAAAGADTHGVDLSAEQLRLAAQTDPLTLYVQGDLETLPYRDGVFDAVVLLGVFEYLETPEAALRELRRVTHACSSLIVSLPNALSPARIWTQQAYIPLSTVYKRWRGKPVPAYSRRLYSLRAFTRLLEGAGFHVATARYFDLVLTPSPFDKMKSRVLLHIVDALELRLKGPLRVLLAGQFMVKAEKVAR